jgi:hypothetical protein
MPEGVPLQSLSRLPGWPTVWRSAPASRGSLALQRHPSTGPRMRQPRFRRVTTVPTPGFLTPSPVSWLDRACGFVSPRCRPWALSPFRAFPSRQVAHPSSGPLAPLPFVPVEPRCGERGLVTSGLHRLGRRSGVVPGRILPRLEAPFQRRSSRNLAAARLATPPGHPGPRTPDSPRSGRSVDFEAFFPARIRSHHATVTRRVEAGALLGVLAPPEPCSRRTWGPLPATAGGVPPPAGSQHAPLGARASDLQDPRAPGTSHGLRHERSAAGDPRRQVESRGDDRSVPRDPSADTALFERGPCRPSAAASTPMTFDERCACAPLTSSSL